ncbi:MAG TPA: tetratricopeptide repeat protein, partial [Kofleriaceae bacterium]
DPSRCSRSLVPASPRARELLDRAAKLDAATRAGRAPSVMPLVPALVADARALDDPRTTSAVLLAAGAASRELGDLETARANMAEAVIAAGKAGDDDRLIEALGAEAAVTTESGRPVDGLGLLDAADAVAARRGGGDDPHIAMLRGNALLEAGKLADAEHVLEHAVKLYEPSAGDPARELDLAAALDLLGVAYYEGNELDKSRPLELRALAIKERVLGPMHPNVAATLGDLGLLEGKANHLDAAEAYVERTRVIFTAAYGADDARVAQTFVTRGYLVARRGKREEGAALTEQGRKLLAKTVPPDDLAFVSIEQQLGAMAGCPAGIPHFERAAAILEQRKTVAETHGVILGQLALCYADAGKLEEAYGPATRSVAELERAGAVPSQLALPWMTLADLEARRGNRARAIAIAEHFLATTTDENDTMASMRGHEKAQLAVWKR